MSVENLRNFIASIRRRRFARNVGALSLASALAQALNVVAFLVLARLYAQDDIGVFSVFLSFGLIVAAVALLSYQLSVLNAADDEFGALMWALIALGALAALVTGVAFGAAGYAFALPLAAFVFLRALGIAVDKVNIRRETYRALIAARLALPAAFLALVLLVYLVSPGAGGLVWAQVLAYAGVTSVYAALSLRGTLVGAWPGPRRLISVLGAHRRFSTLVFPSQILNLLAFHLPTVFIERYLGPGVAAQYALTQRVCQVPVSVIGNAVGQAYHGRLASCVRDGARGAYERFAALARGLWLAAAVLWLIMFGLFPPLLRWLLGEEWALAGTLVRVMSPLFATMIVVVPLSVTFYVLERQGYALASQAALFAAALAGFGYAVASGDLVAGAAVFTALSVAANVYYFIRIRQVSREGLMPGGGGAVARG